MLCRLYVRVLPDHWASPPCIRTAQGSAPGLSFITSPAVVLCVSLSLGCLLSFTLLFQLTTFIKLHPEPGTAMQSQPALSPQTAAPEC